MSPIRVKHDRFGRRKVMKVLVMCALLCALAVSGAMAAGGKQVDIPITQGISDYDGNNVPFYIQSDGLGLYSNTVTSHGQTTGDRSVLMSNVCNGLTNGDRLLDTQVRKVRVTLDNTNACQPGDTNCLVPAQTLGTIVSTVRTMNTCTCDTNQSMYKMAAGSTIFCPMHLKLYNFNYRLDMGTTGENETQRVQIYCNAADSAGCKEWFIDPISDLDYTTNPGKTRARLVNLSNGQNMGNYYMTFDIHVTRP